MSHDLLSQNFSIFLYNFTNSLSLILHKCDYLTITTLKVL